MDCWCLRQPAAQTDTHTRSSYPRCGDSNDPFILCMTDLFIIHWLSLAGQAGRAGRQQSRLPAFGRHPSLPWLIENIYVVSPVQRQASMCFLVPVFQRNVRGYVHGYQESCRSLLLDCMWNVFLGKGSHGRVDRYVWTFFRESMVRMIWHLRGRRDCNKVKVRSRLGVDILHNSRSKFVPSKHLGR